MNTQPKPTGNLAFTELVLIGISLILTTTASDDLKQFKDVQEVCDQANQFDHDANRRKYLYSRGLDIFPDEPMMLQQW